MHDSRFQTVVIFKNHDTEAGTSLAHPHWQLVATPVVPRLLRQKHFEAREYFGGAEVSLATETEIAERCPDCEFGVLPPFGSQYNLKTLAEVPNSIGTLSLVPIAAPLPVSSAAPVPGVKGEAVYGKEADLRVFVDGGQAGREQPMCMASMFSRRAAGMIRSAHSGWRLVSCFKKIGS